LSSIRVTYSGLISFCVSIISLITGLVFTLVVTRQLTQDEFGTWSLIGVLVSYVLVIQPIINVWITREVARDVDSGRTALISTSMFSAMGIAVYLVLVLIMGESVDVELGILIFTAILIPVYFFRNLFAAISLGHKPQLVEYGLLIFEITKIPLGFIFVFYLDWGLMGAILTIFISILANLSFLVFRLKGLLIGEFRFERLKKWLKLFWIPTYPQLSRIIYNLDMVIFTLISGAVGAIAYWGASVAISQSVIHSSKINVAIYPKLLGGGKKEIFQENLLRVFYFSFPLSAMAITFAEPGLFTLNPLYREATTVTVFLVLMVFQMSLIKVFSSFLGGIEKVDEDDKSTFMQYVKSKLFLLPTLSLFHAVGYFISLMIALVVVTQNDFTELEMVETWALIAFLCYVPYILTLYALVRREFSPSLKKSSLITYLLASIGSFGFVYFLMKEYLIYQESIFKFFPSLIPYMILAVSMYLGITFATDSKTRFLFRAVFKELRKKTSGEANE
jgi:O-antigen/teichoic acid export membrane protein